MFDAIVEWCSSYLPDLVAFGFYSVFWCVYNQKAYKHKNVEKPSMLVMIQQLHVRWLVVMQNQDNRTPDIPLLKIAISNCKFFASTSIVLIAGLVALLAIPDILRGLLGTIPFASGRSLELLWLKEFLLIAVFGYSFIKFTMSIRQNFNCGVLICAMPTSSALNQEHAWNVAHSLSPMFSRAGNNFNKGLCAYYFGAAMLAWFVNPYFFMASTVITVSVLLYSEFSSNELRDLKRAESILKETLQNPETKHPNSS